jgi:hypothetical protein
LRLDAHVASNETEKLNKFEVVFKSGRKMSANKKRIREIWGNTNQAKEIERVFSERGLDLLKLEKCCEEKGQSIRVATGYVLGMQDTYDVLVQCACGEVMGFSSDVYDAFVRLYGNEIKCKRCDPQHIEKLEKVTSQLGYKGRTARINFPTRDEDFLP